MKRAGAFATAAAIAVAIGASASQASTPAPIVFAANRAPTLTGEIYRLDPNGHRVDLSRSPLQDTSPAVSPDGEHVAFIRTNQTSPSRGGPDFSDLYEIGVDGRGLVAIALRTRGLYSNTALFWQPHGDMIAAGSRIFEPGHRPINLAFSLDATFSSSMQPWSPDGSALLLSTTLDNLKTVIRAVSPQGRTLWTKTVAGETAGAWSSSGLLAISSQGAVRVYDEAGHTQFKARAKEPQVSWSPDGNLLAASSYVTHGMQLRIWTANGGLVLEKHLPSSGDITWDTRGRLVVGGTGRCKFLDARTGAATTRSCGYLFYRPRSADGKLAIVMPQKGAGFALGAAPIAGGPATKYGGVPRCADSTHGWWEAAVSGYQFAGHSIVYSSWGDYCAGPFDDLYSVGGAIHRLTNTPEGEMQPALSPDGSEIAYAWWPGGECAGGPAAARRIGYLPVPCSEELRIANADGRHSRTLTSPSNECASDSSPTWSPDGMTILYAKTLDWPCKDFPVTRLWSVAATGEDAHALHIEGSDPAWGPTRIAYVAPGGLTTANPDGSDPHLVAKNGSCPAWSGDGRLAYVTGHSPLLVVGSGRVKLPFSFLCVKAWTQDDRRLVIRASKTAFGPFDLYTVNPDGSGLKQLTKNYGVD